MTSFPRVDRISKVAKAYKPSSSVFPTGIECFDTATDGGLREGELIIISGPTGMGKTTFSQMLIANYSQAGVPSILFTYEMNPWYIQSKFESMGHPDLHCFVPNTDPEGTLSYIEDHIKEGFDDHLCKVVFIDHLHYLIPLQESKNSSLMIGGIVRELVQMAHRTKSIIFLIAHTKKIYQDEELNLSSVRDSSLVVQEADYVFLIERLKKERQKQKSLQDSITEKLETNKTEWTNLAKIQLAKNRRTGDMVYEIFKMENKIFLPQNENDGTTENIF